MRFWQPRSHSAGIVHGYRADPGYCSGDNGFWALRHRRRFVKFGVFDHLDRAGGPDTDIGRQYADRLALTEHYDRAGLYAYHVAEHHGTPLGMAPSPGMFLAAVAQRTTRLRFGPLVSVLGLQHPV